MIAKTFRGTNGVSRIAAIAAKSSARLLVLASALILGSLVMNAQMEEGGDVKLPTVATPMVDATAQSPAKGPARRVPTTVWTKADYEKFTYTWTDSAGVKHTNNITEKATQPKQIRALLKEIYTNDSIPGTKQLPTADSPDSVINVNYNFHYQGDTVRYVKCWRDDPLRWNEDSTVWDRHFISPINDGLTVLLVEVKNDFNGFKSYSDYTFKGVLNAMKSVQLITGTRIDNGDGNPRTIFTAPGDYNRFYFLAKGKFRDNLGPDMLFEEISPSQQAYDTQVTDFYAKLIEGVHYKTIHDCDDVMYNEHYFSISGKNVKRPST